MLLRSLAVFSSALFGVVLGQSSTFDEEGTTTDTSSAAVATKTFSVGAVSIVSLDINHVVR